MSDETTTARWTLSQEREASVIWVIDLNGWLESYDPDGGDPAVPYPTGTFGVTTDLAKALRFPDAPSAIKFWSATSTRTPQRPDGKPNRPLTRYSIEVRHAPVDVAPQGGG